MSNPDRVAQMNEYREAREYARQVRENALELDDLVDELQWVAAGGRGAPDPEKFQRLVEATQRLCEDLAEMDLPDPREIGATESTGQEDATEPALSEARPAETSSTTSTDDDATDTASDSTPDTADETARKTTADHVIDALDQKGELPSKEIASPLDVTTAAVHRVLRELKQEGRITARQDPEDGRRKLYSLTDTDDRDDEGDEDASTGGNSTDASATDLEVTDVSAAVDEDTASPDTDLPDGVTVDDIEAAAEENETLGEVATQLDLTPGRARVVLVHTDCYGQIRDITNSGGHP
ncbi:MarR family transcriptional regulator [Salarchaeum sp. III]|uniref:MarR family transcriptional regulator n=1 Tax=Salarchaeum sp. III TaxID=3107927 RepID=UPI002ED98DC7